MCVCASVKRFFFFDGSRTFYLSRCVRAFVHLQNSCTGVCSPSVGKTGAGSSRRCLSVPDARMVRPPLRCPPSDAPPPRGTPPMVAPSPRSAQDLFMRHVGLRVHAEECIEAMFDDNAELCEQVEPDVVLLPVQQACTASPLQEWGRPGRRCRGGGAGAGRSEPSGESRLDPSPTSLAPVSPALSFLRFIRGRGFMPRSGPQYRLTDGWCGLGGGRGVEYGRGALAPPVPADHRPGAGPAPPPDAGAAPGGPPEDPHPSTSAGP